MCVYIYIYTHRSQPLRTATSCKASAFQDAIRRCGELPMMISIGNSMCTYVYTYIYIYIYIHTYIHTYIYTVYVCYR